MSAAHRSIVALARGEGSETPSSDTAQGSVAAPGEEIERGLGCRLLLLRLALCPLLVATVLTGVNSCRRPSRLCLVDEKAAVFCFDHFIALADVHFQCTAVNNDDPAVLIGNPPLHAHFLGG
jgi:hypothetical protein